MLSPNVMKLRHLAHVTTPFSWLGAKAGWGQGSLFG